MSSNPNTQELLTHTRCARLSTQSGSETTLSIINGGKILLVDNKGSQQTITKEQLKKPEDLIDWGCVNTKDNLTGKLQPIFTIKQLQLDAKAQTPNCVDLHQHKYWILVSGSALVTIDNEPHPLGEHQYILLPPLKSCKLINNTNLPLVMLQFESKAGFSGDERIEFKDGV